MIKKTETSTEIKELENGTVDYIPDVVDANKINTVAKDKDKGLTMDSYPSDREDFLFMNTAAGACQDQAVRQALAYGFDREAYIASYYKLDDKDAKLAYVPGLFGNPVSGENSAYVRGEEKVDGATYYDYDVEKAKQILDDAGWTVGSDGIREKNGQKLSIKFLAVKEKDAMDTMIPMLQKQWGELGVDFKANTMEFNTVISTVGDDSAVSDWDVSYLGNSFTSPEDTGVDYFIQSQGVNNFARLKDDELDSYLAAGAYTADKEASAAAYFVKEKDAMDTMIPMLQKQWGELGVDFKANTMEFNTVISTVGDDSAVGDWDVSYLGNSFTSPEDTGVDYFIQSQGVNNFARLKDDELDSYLAAGAYTADKEASAAAYLKAYVRQAELCAYLPTDGVQTYCLRNKKVKGLKTSSTFIWSDGVQTYCLRNKKVKGLKTSSTFIWSQSMATAYIDD